jgi:hypothetical protein
MPLAHSLLPYQLQKSRHNRHNHHIRNNPDFPILHLLYQLFFSRNIDLLDQD